MSVKTWDDGKVEQLALGLELDEVGEDAAERAISVEEARALSEQARRLWERTATADYAYGADYAEGSGGKREKPVWFEEYLKLVELGRSWGGVGGWRCILRGRLRRR